MFKCRWCVDLVDVLMSLGTVLMWLMSVDTVLMSLVPLMTVLMW
jgi:hypothetical protein